jgi:hypothetical protein
VVRLAIVALMLVGGVGSALGAPVELSWDTNVEGGRIWIHYRVRNRSHQRIYILNRRLIDEDVVELKGSDFTWTTRALVLVDKDDSARFVLGPVEGEQAAAEVVEPGATLAGVSDIEWPIKELANGKKPPGSLTSAVLELFYVSGRVHWRSERIRGGDPVQVPVEGTPLRSVRSTPLPLPR